MLDSWIKFQAASGEIFANLYSYLPGSDLFRLSIISALLGVILVWLYSFVSFQKTLKKLKTKITAVALEPFVFSDSARISLFTPLRLVGLGLGYMGLTIPPLLILALPAIWVMGLLNQMVGYDIPKVGEQILISVAAENSRDLRKLDLQIQGEDFRISPLVRHYPEAKAWAALDVQANKGDNNSLALKVGDVSTIIPLSSRPQIAVLSNGFWTRLLYPGAKITLPPGIDDLSISFASRDYKIIGLQTSWIVILLVVSMLSGFIFARVLKSRFNASFQLRKLKRKSCG